MTETAPTVLSGYVNRPRGRVCRPVTRRGHNLVLVARDTTRMETLAARLRERYSVEVDVLTADLAKEEDLDVVAKRLETDDRITDIVNNAGMSLSGTFTHADTSGISTV